MTPSCYYQQHKGILPQDSRSEEMDRRTFEGPRRFSRREQVVFEIKENETKKSDFEMNTTMNTATSAEEEEEISEDPLVLSASEQPPPPPEAPASSSSTTTHFSFFHKINWWTCILVGFSVALVSGILVGVVLHFQTRRTVNLSVVETDHNPWCHAPVSCEEGESMEWTCGLEHVDRVFEKLDLNSTNEQDECSVESRAIWTVASALANSESLEQDESLEIDEEIEDLYWLALVLLELGVDLHSTTKPLTANKCDWPASLCVHQNQKWLGLEYPNQNLTGQIPTEIGKLSNPSEFLDM